jgi:gamma-glutamyltranspeptidase/glutathione hydrolase
LPDIAVQPVAAIHWVAEASRLAFADRNFYLGDPDFVDVPVAALLDPVYFRTRAALISPERAAARVAPGEPLPAAAWNYAASPPQEMVSTSHLSIVDRFGGAVSMTTSVQSTFGSQLMVGGFILNNQLTDFSFRPQDDGRPVANRVEPGKRPRSSMSPTIVLDSDGRLFAAVGSPGGSRIIGYVTQTLIGLMDWSMTMQEAIDMGRAVDRNGPLELEAGTGIAAQADALRALGQEVNVRPLNSGLHGIRRTAQGLDGGADRRREGVVLRLGGGR